MLIENALKKLQKNSYTKSYPKNVMEISPFSTFTHVHQFGFLITFFAGFFLQLFQRF